MSDTTIMASHASQQPSFTFAHDASHQVRQLLAEPIALLGPCTPLPALFEEVLRTWRGLSVASRRYRRAGELIAEIRALPGGMTALASAITDIAAPLNTRLLAATLWAYARPEQERLSLPDGMPVNGDDANWLPISMACLPYPDPDERYVALLLHLLFQEQRVQGQMELPTPLLLLSFLHGLTAGTL